GQVALVGYVEEDRERAGREPDDIELPDRESRWIDRVDDRDRHQGEGSAEIAGDEDRPPAQTGDPGAGRQGEEDERQELDCSEHRELEGVDMENQGGQQTAHELAARGS